MSTKAEINMFGKELNVGADGHPDTVISEIIKPIKKEIDKKMEKHNLPKDDALTLVLEDWAPAYDPYGTSIINRGPCMGYTQFSYRVDDENIEVKLEPEDQEITFDWQEIKELDRDGIRERIKDAKE